ncbi:MAG: peptidylprolyl isomerase [Dehalococcoidales bacterium]|nr:MAG: peptidylprolyl isomerase [Dehalococcoidales bacterium]
MKKLSLISLILLSLLVIPLSGCGEEKVVEAGDYVKVHYTGTLDDGSVFDSSEGRDPLAFTAGAGQMIKGFDAAVIGMKVGEEKTVTIPAEDAYGPHDDELILTFTKDELPEGMDPKVDDQLALTQSNGRQVRVVVIEVTDKVVVVDANHELAGKDLTFEIELVEITKGK